MTEFTRLSKGLEGRLIRGGGFGRMARINICNVLEAVRVAIIFWHCDYAN